MAGLGCAFILHSLVGGVRSEAQLALGSGLDSLAVVRFGGRSGVVSALLWWLPIWKSDDASGATGGEAGRGELNGGATLANRLRVYKTIGFVSARRGAGRSTLASELAHRLSKCGSKVLLVDADIANPALTQMRSSEGVLGLLDVLGGRATLADALQATPGGGPEFLPIGKARQRSNLDDGTLCGSVQQLHEEMRQRFDHVVFDLPTCERDPDGTIIAAHLDACVLVVAADTTPMRIVAEMVSVLIAAKVGLAGTALNHPRPV
jgi:Mrp family chromosome partitioning ATPase